MENSVRPGLRLVDRFLLLGAWLLSCSAVYGLGFYTGSHIQERVPDDEDRIVRLPVTAEPPPAGQRAKAADDFTFYDTLVPGGTPARSAERAASASPAGASSKPEATGTRPGSTASRAKGPATASGAAKTASRTASGSGKVSKPAKGPGKGAGVRAASPPTAPAAHAKAHSARTLSASAEAPKRVTGTPAAAHAPGKPARPSSGAGASVDGPHTGRAPSAEGRQAVPPARQRTGGQRHVVASE